MGWSRKASEEWQFELDPPDERGPASSQPRAPACAGQGAVWSGLSQAVGRVVPGGGWEGCSAHFWIRGWWGAQTSRPTSSPPRPILPGSLCSGPSPQPLLASLGWGQGPPPPLPIPDFVITLTSPSSLSLLIFIRALLGAQRTFSAFVLP